MAQTVLQGSTLTAFTAGNTYYPSLGNTYLNTSATEANSQTIYRTAGTLSKLYIVVPNNSNTTSTFRTRVNGGNGNLSVSIGNSATGQFEDNTHTDSISAGNNVCYQLVVGTGGTNTWISVASVLFDVTTDFLIKFSATSTSGTGTSTASQTLYGLPVGRIGFGSTESQNYLKTPVAGTWKNFYVYISANARTTTTTYGSRKNTANGNMSVSVGSTATGAFEDTSNTDTVAVDDTLDNFRTTGTGTGTITTQQVASEFLSSNSIYPMVMGDGVGVAQNFNTTNYLPIAGGHTATFSEGWYRADIRQVGTLSKMETNIYGNTLNSGTSTMTLRKGGSSVNQTLSIGFGSTGEFADSSNSDIISVWTDELAVQVVTSGTSGALGIGDIHFKFVVTSFSKSESITVSESVNMALAHQIKVSDTITTTESVNNALAHQIQLQDGSIDQQNTSGSIGIGFGDTLNGRDYMAQGFTAAFNNINAIAFYLNGKSGTSTQGYKVWIDNADASYFPTGTVGVGIGGATEITNAQLVTGALTKYNLASSVTLTPGNRYVICFAPWNTTTHTYSSDYQDFTSSTANPYANGRRVHGDGNFTNWSAPDTGNADLQFRTYGNSGETITVTENTKLLLESNINKNDSITVTESQQLTLVSQPKVSDNITVSESVKVVLESNINVSDTITTTESTTVQNTTGYATVSDTITTTENVVVTVSDPQLTTSDNITVSESVQIITSDPQVLVSDSINLTESVNTTLVNNIVVDDTVSVTDTPTITPEASTDILITVSDTITITESSIVLLASDIKVSDSITVSEAFQDELEVALNIQEVVTVTENVNVVMPNALKINVSDSITVTDTPTVYRALVDFLISVSDSITVSESQTVDHPHVPDPTPKLIYIDGKLAYLIADTRIPHYIFV